MKFDGFAIQLNGLGLEVHANGVDVALCVCVISKPQNQAWLAHTRVTNQK
jgi:hypothetical protein